MMREETSLISVIRRQPTRIGVIKQVLGSQLTVALDEDIAGVAPIFESQLLQIGQIGSLVRIPQGLVDLIGQVSLLGIAELAGAQEPTQVIQTGERWLQVHLLGEIERGASRFERGVGSYPGLDDPVHFATAKDLTSVFPCEGDDFLRLGRLSATAGVPVCLDARRLVTRHAAVVGSTGSGKTSAVSTILQRFARRGWPGANIVVIDPHGEYANALSGSSSVRSVLGVDEESRLSVPHWTLPAAEILRAFVGASANSVTISRFEELVAEGRRSFAASASWLDIEPVAITPDTPVPFDLRRVWYRLDYENNWTVRNKNDESSVCIQDAGCAEDLLRAQFEPYAQGNAAPFKGPGYGAYGRTPEILRLGIADPRMRFLQDPAHLTGENDPLTDVLRSWLGNGQPVSVLDFSGVPAEVAELAIGVVLRLLFDVVVRTPPGAAGGIGRPSPVLVVLEEAHRYLSESATRIARESANRIAREGRKYGIGLLLVTQRPSELPDTALAQCGTIIALRLTNSADQSKIKAALPDGVAGLASILPSLRTGEAVVTGESVALPSRLLVDAPNPFPLAEDPSLDAWRVSDRKLDLVPAIAAWREAYS